MSRVIVELTADTYYNIDFNLIRDLLSIPLDKTSWGFIADTSSYSLLIGLNGGLKIGIEFTDHEDFVQKLNLSLVQLFPLIEYYKFRYSDDILKKLALSWSDDYSHNSFHWSFADATYKEKVFDSDYGLKYSELVQI